MLCTPAFKAIGLLAAFVVGAAASPISSLQLRDSVAEGTMVQSNCPSGSKDLICSFKYLSYENSGVEPHQACGVFNDTCENFGGNNVRMDMYCSNDKHAQVITASCVQAKCDGTFLSFTSAVGFHAKSRQLGVRAFFPVDKCKNGKDYCYSKTDRSKPDPPQIYDPNPPVNFCHTVYPIPP